MSAAQHFSENYAEAREKFCAATAAAGGALRSYLNPKAKGSQGEPLFLDTARFGAADAPKMLVLISGTHGVEGFCGSGSQISWLRTGGPLTLPADTGALLVHAINPYGFSWIRRVTEDNVDLNRNFVDHAKPYPANEGYRAIAAALKPERWDESGLADAQRVLDRFIQEHGAFGFQQAVSGGQYSHPDGMFFGGHTPTWSNRTIRRIIREELGAARRIGVIDFHTGLGPFGHGEIICVSPPGTTGFDRTQAWYGTEVTSPEQGTSTSAIVVGVMVDAFPQEAPDAEVTSIAIEYGTHPVNEVLEAVRKDNWLHLHGRVDSPQGRDMKAFMRERFYPAGDKWAEMVWSRADQVIGMALQGLGT